MIIVSLGTMDGLEMRNAFRQAASGQAASGRRTSQQMLSRKLDAPFGKVRNRSRHSSRLEAAPVRQSVEEMERLAAMTPEEIAADRTLGKQILFGLCLLWATNFAVIEQIFEACPGLHPSLYSFIRFGIASVILLPTYYNKLTDVRLVKNATIIGMYIFAGYIGQALALANGSTPEKTSFIASLVVVYTPLLQGFIKKDFGGTVWSAVTMALCGIAGLELGGSATPSFGDLYAFAQPIGFGTSYILLEKVFNGGDAELFTDSSSNSIEGSGEEFEPVDPAALTGLRILFITVASAGWALMSGQDISKLKEVLSNSLAIDDILYTGIVSTALGIFLQTLGSSKVKATDVSIIFSVEPVFATIFSIFYLGSAFSSLDVCGGGLVLVACIANEYDLVKKRWRSS